MDNLTIQVGVDIKDADIIDIKKKLSSIKLEGLSGEIEKLKQSVSNGSLKLDIKGNASAQIENITDNIQALGVALSNAEKKIDVTNINSVIGVVKKQVSDIKETLEAKGKTFNLITQFEEQVEGSSQKTAELTKKINSLKERLNFADETSSVEAINSELDKLKNNLSLELKSEKVKADFDNLDKAVTNFEEKLGNMASKNQGFQALKKEIQEIKSELDSASKSLSEGGLDSVSKKISTANTKLSGIKPNSIVEGDIETATASIDTLLSKLNGIKNKFEISGMSAEPVQQVIDKVTKLKSELETVSSSGGLSKLKNQISAVKQEISTLNEQAPTSMSNKTVSELADPNKIESARINLDKFKKKVEEVKSVLTSMESDTTGIENVSNQISKMEASSEKISTKGDLAKFNNDLKKAKNSLADIEKDIPKINQLDNIKVSNKLSKYLRETKKLSEENREKIIKWLEVLEKNPDTKGLAKIKEEFEKLKGKAEETGEASKSFGDKLKENIGKFTDFISAGTVVMKTINGIKSSFSDVVSLDKELVDLQLATGKTQKETSELLTTYNGLAKELGATTAEVSQSANAWLRQGKTQEETTNLIRASMILSKVGQMESAEATEKLTAVMKGYKISVEDAMRIVDKLTTIDLKSATSTSGLAEAISRTANSASIAGVSIEKLLGYLSVTGEVTQKSMDSVGESYKTIFARMGNIKVGKFTDDETNEDLSDVEATLHKVGIALRSSENEFRSFEDVLDEIGGKWKSFNDLEQNAIANAIAGTKQRENFLVLMENYDRALELSNVADTADGNAMKKFEAYQEGIEARTKSLRASVEGLSNILINSNLLKFLLDVAQGLIQLLSLGDGAVIKITAITITLMALSKAIESFQLGRIKRNISDIIGGLSSTQKALLAIAVAVSAATFVFDFLTTSIDEVKTSIEEANKASEDLKSAQESLNGINDKIAEIQDKGTLSIIDKQELKDLETEKNILADQVEYLRLKKELADKKASKDAVDWASGLTKGLSWKNIWTEIVQNTSGGGIFGYLFDGQSFSEKFVSNSVVSIGESLSRIDELKRSLDGKSNSEQLDIWEKIQNEGKRITDLQESLRQIYEDDKVAFDKIAEDNPFAKQTKESLQSEMDLIQSVIQVDSLTQAKDELVQASYLSGVATEEETKAYYENAKGAEFAAQAMEILNSRKFLLQQTKIDTTQDVENLLNMARAAQASAQAISTLSQIKVLRGRIDNGIGIDASQQRWLSEQEDKIAKGTFFNFEPISINSPSPSNKDLSPKKDGSYTPQKKSSSSSPSKTSKSSTDNTADKIKSSKKQLDDLKDRYANASKKLAEAWEQEYLERLKDDLNKHKDILDRYVSQLDLIKNGISLLDQNSFEQRNDLLGKQLKSSLDYGLKLREEFERVSKITPQTAEQAQVIADRIKEIGNQLRDNVSTIRESYIEIAKIRVTAYQQIVTNQSKDIEREINRLNILLDNVKDRYEGTGKYTDDLLETDLLFSSLSTDNYERLKLRQQEDSKIIDEETKLQETINGIVTDALNRQIQSNAEKRAEQRAEISKEIAAIQQEITDKNNEISQMISASTKATSEQVGQVAQETSNSVVETAKNGSDAVESNVEGNADDASKYIKDTYDSLSNYFISNPFVWTVDTSDVQTKFQEIEGWYNKIKNFNWTVGADIGGGSLSEMFSQGSMGANYTGKASSYGFQNPTATGRISSGFGKRKSFTTSNGKKSSSNHNAIDIATNRTSVPVYAVSNGTITRSGYVSGYGYTVEITHPNGIVTKYHHMASPSPYKSGTKVSKGQQIGKTGATGNATGIHLDFQVVHGGKLVNPLNYIPGYAEGTESSEKGIALLGEEGYELVKLPDGTYAVVGINGLMLGDLPKDTTVIPHDQAEKLLKDKVDFNEVMRNTTNHSITKAVDTVQKPKIDFDNNYKRNLYDFMGRKDTLTPENYEQGLEHFIYSQADQGAKMWATTAKEVGKLLQNYYDLVDAEKVVFDSAVVEQYAEAYDDAISKAESFEKTLTEMEQKSQERLQNGMSELKRYLDKITESYEKQQKSIDKQIELENGKLSILEQEFATLEKVREAQHSADRAIANSRVSKQYLNPYEYEKIFNEKDYNKIIRKVASSKRVIEDLAAEYTEKITQAYNDGDMYLVQAFVKEYKTKIANEERSLAITQAEIELRQKEENLNNVLAERNVRFLNRSGEWEWVANADNVRSALEEKLVAQDNLEDLRWNDKNQLLLNSQQSVIDGLDIQKAEIDKQIEQLNDFFGRLEEAVDNVINPLVGFGEVLNLITNFGNANIDKALSNFVEQYNTDTKKENGSVSGNTVNSAQSRHIVVVSDKVPDGAKVGDVYGGSDGISFYRIDKINPDNTYESHLIKAVSDNRAERGLPVGTVVETEGGRYLIKSVNADGSYNSVHISDKNGYASGTVSAMPGWRYVDENGSESYIGTDGTLHNFKGGETVFNAEQTKALWLMSKQNGYGVTPNIRGTQNIQNNETSYNLYGDVNVSEVADFNGFMKQLIDTFNKRR